MKNCIVGGGIAGISLAFDLLERGEEVVIYDFNKNQSSSVAAGMVNPLVFRRMTKSWRVDELIPFARTFYKKLENITGAQFMNEIVIRRFFASDQERELWIQKQNLPDFSDYMEPLTQADLEFESPENGFGTARLKNAFWIDTFVFLPAVWAYFEKLGVLRKEEFFENELNHESSTYKNEYFDHFFFCYGKDNLYSDMWGYLPVEQTKGELLEVVWSDFSLQDSWNRKCFLIPTNRGTFQVGSTYEWNTDNIDLTDSSKELILKNLESLKSEEPTLVSHRAGVRPTTLDRRVILGRHLKYKNCFIFNGLGAKGNMIAPLIANELCAHVYDQKPILKEISTERFLKKDVRVNSKF